MDLSEAFEGKKIKSIMGIATGSTYCSIIGSTSRCEYSLSGDAIDTSRKLIKSGQFIMETQNRGNVILCDGITRDDTRHLIYYEFICKLKIKGKNDETSVYEPFEQAFLGKDKKEAESDNNIHTEGDDIDIVEGTENSDVKIDSIL